MTRTDGMAVAVFGATGTIGRGALQASLEDPRVAEVRAVTRRPVGLAHDKLREVYCEDFADFSAIANDLAGVDVCLWCLGVSARKVSEEEAYRRIHVGFPLAAAEVFRDVSPRVAFVYVSGAGTKAGSRMMWARVKAEAEARLAEIGLGRAVSVRPAFIIPADAGLATRWLLAPLATILGGMAIHGVALGRAMLTLATSSDVPTAPVEHRELKRLGSVAPS